MTKRHFEDWLFFLSAWLSSFAKPGETWPDGTPREVLSDDRLRDVFQVCGRWDGDAFHVTDVLEGAV